MIRLWHGALLLVSLLISACASINPYYDPERSHHRPDGFVNRHGLALGQLPAYEIFWRRLRGDFRPSAPPEGGYPAFIKRWTVPVDRKQIDDRSAPPRITWLGHATLLLQAHGLNILIDPQLSDYAGPLSWLSAKRRVPASLSVDALPRIDLVLISHNHYDHLDEATILGLHAAGQTPRYLVPLGVKRWFDERQIANVSELDWWDSQPLGAGLVVHFTPAQHWSKRTPFDTNTTLWGGFFLDFTVDREQFTFLYTGDTGYSDDFITIRQHLGTPDIVALPVGAYEPRDFMAPQHISPDDAVRILLDLGARQGIGIHWGSFELTQERFDQPPIDLTNALAARQLPADLIWMSRQGETRRLPVVAQ